MTKLAQRSYANSVLQALYFCQPFRDLVCFAPDPTAPLVPQQPIQPSSIPSSPKPGQPPITSPPPNTFHKRKHSASDAHTNTLLPSITAITASGPQPLALPQSPQTLFSALRSLFLHIATHPSSKGMVSPQSFINKLKKENELFRSSMHQDAHEFLNYLLNKIVEDLGEMEKNEDCASLYRLFYMLALMGSLVLVVSTSIASMATSTTTTTAMSTSTPTTSTGTSHTSTTPHPTLVHSLFEGTLTNETRCLTCENVRNCRPYTASWCHN
jgi:ubiquitin carboxyl-terminal hydrolase 9/13